MNKELFENILKTTGENLRKIKEATAKNARIALVGIALLGLLTSCDVDSTGSGTILSPEKAGQNSPTDESGTIPSPNEAGENCVGYIDSGGDATVCISGWEDKNNIPEGDIEVVENGEIYHRPTPQE